MKKKNRARKINVYIACEGDREEVFLRFLQELFDPDKQIAIKFSPEKGGTSNAILDRALKNLFHLKTYAWFDEDDPLDEEHKKALEKYWNIEITNDIKDADLQKKNIKMIKPIVIVSTPYSIEGIIIRLFNKKMPELINPVNSIEDFKENKVRMKNSISGFFAKDSDDKYYRKNLTKEYIIEKSEKIEELKLLLTIFDID